jgi:hypothetical protein
MVRRPTPPPKPERPNLTVEQKRRRIERLQKCIQELEAFDPQTVQKRFPPERRPWERASTKRCRQRLGTERSSTNAIAVPRG